MFSSLVKSAFISLLLAFMCLAAAPIPTQAISWVDQANNGGLNAIGSDAYGQNGAPSKSLQMIIFTLIRIFLGTLGIIFLVLIILAGFKYMTASGNDEKVKEATAQIRQAVIGLLIVLTAYSITLFITRKAVTEIVNSR